MNSQYWVWRKYNLCTSSNPMPGFFRITFRPIDLECERAYCQFLMAVDRAAFYTPSGAFSLATKQAGLQRSCSPLVSHSSNVTSLVVWSSSFPNTSNAVTERSRQSIGQTLS